ncbi:hypothetical protein C7428_1800 [Pantoea ananatis]|nr:hypothetical protein C7428_1800 [Pantoea ananatis]
MAGLFIAATQNLTSHGAKLSPISRSDVITRSYRVALCCFYICFFIYSIVFS